MEKLNENELDGVVGGSSLFIKDAGYEDIDGIGYFKYSISYDDEASRKAAIASLKKFRNFDERDFPTASSFTGTIGFGMYYNYDKKYHNVKIIK